jgi:uncharacterized protein YlxP (DUF503 family)
MLVGVLRLELTVHDAFSLKEKRSVVRRVIDKVRNRFKVAVGEVEDQDILTSAVIGVALVGSDRRVLNSVIDRIVAFVDQEGSAELTTYEFDIFEP